MRLLEEAERYAEQFDRSALSAAPLTGVVILTCMDARIVVEDIFGLRAGDAHVMRNAGALASDDFIRSLVVSQRVLGTNEVVVLGHTGCGLHDLDEPAFVSQLTREVGAGPELPFGAFTDLDEHVRRQAQRIREHPLVRRVPVHALIYEVESGRLRHVAPP